LVRDSSAKKTRSATYILTKWIVTESFCQGNINWTIRSLLASVDSVTRDDAHAGELRE